MTPAILVSAFIAGATYTLIPGPAFLALLGIGAASGRKAGAGFVIGHLAGDLTWASLSLVAIIGARAIGHGFFDALGLICGVYLCWLGGTALRAKRDASGKLAGLQPKRPMLRGLTFGMTNPKGYPVAIAMFTALLSSSADKLSWSVFPELLAAAFVGFLIADVILVAFVGAAWVRSLYRRYDVWIARASGLIFIGFGLHAIVEAGPGSSAGEAEGALAHAGRRRHAPPHAAEAHRFAVVAEAPTDRYERRAKRRGAKLVAGVDEAGRGPLAGPVVVAAVAFPHGRYPRRARRFQEAHRRPARASSTRRSSKRAHGVGRRRQPGAHRPHEHPQGLAVGDEPGRRRPARGARPRSGRRQHEAARPRLRLRDGDRRRPPVACRSPPPRSSPR